MYGAFTMESLLAAAFGRVVDVQKGEADEVTKAMNRLFGFAKGKLFLFCFLLLSKFICSKHSPLLFYLWHKVQFSVVLYI